MDVKLWREPVTQVLSYSLKLQMFKTNYSTQAFMMDNSFKCFLQTFPKLGQFIYHVCVDLYLEPLILFVLEMGEKIEKYARL